MARKLSFTEEDMKTMEALYRQGYSTAEIAKRYDCLAGSVWKRLQQRGVELRPPTFKRSGLAFHSQGYAMYGGEYVHRIVAAAWLGRELREGEVVHHKNGDKLDNRPENLEVCQSNGRHVSEHHVSVWTPERKLQLRRLTEAGWTAQQIATLMGVTTNAVNNQRRWLKRKRPSRAKART